MRATLEKIMRRPTYRIVRHGTSHLHITEFICDELRAASARRGVEASDLGPSLNTAPPSPKTTSTPPRSLDIERSTFRFVSDMEEMALLSPLAVMGLD